MWWAVRKAIRARRPLRRGRGLKLVLVLFLLFIRFLSPPTQGAWIEIEGEVSDNAEILVAPYAGGVD